MDRKYMFVVMGLGVVVSANVSAMQGLDKGCQAGRRALLAVSGIASRATTEGMNAAMQGSPSRCYTPAVGNLVAQRLRELSVEVETVMNKNRAQRHRGMAMGTVIEDALELAKIQCDQRDKLLRLYETANKKDETPLVLAERSSLREKLKKEDKALQEEREKLSKDWTLFVSVTSVVRQLEWLTGRAAS